jgi:hypothetical protein
MSAINSKLRSLSEEQLCALSEGIEKELQRRHERRFHRGHQRSTFMNDIVLGNISAPRFETAPRRRAA